MGDRGQEGVHPFPKEEALARRPEYHSQSINKCVFNAYLRSGTVPAPGDNKMTKTALVPALQLLTASMKERQKTGAKAECRPGPVSDRELGRE